MSHRPLQVAFPNDPGWKPFGDRLDFLSPEKQHLNTGKLKPLPPLHPEKRQGFPSDKKVTVNFDE